MRNREGFFVCVSTQLTAVQLLAVQLIAVSCQLKARFVDGRDDSFLLSAFSFKLSPLSSSFNFYGK